MVQCVWGLGGRWSSCCSQLVVCYKPASSNHACSNHYHLFSLITLFRPTLCPLGTLVQGDTTRVFQKEAQLLYGVVCRRSGLSMSRLVVELKKDSAWAPLDKKYR